jgi:Flp pilus assembly pilin Flp
MTRRAWALLKRWRDCRGQDLIEYALVAGFVAVAAGAAVPGVSHELSHILSRVNRVLIRAANTGSPGRQPAPPSPVDPF